MLGTFARSYELRSTEATDLVEKFAPQTRRAFSGNAGATPVVICARNEGQNIAATLVSLADSGSEVLPVVVDNGSEDQTVDVAHTMGAVVLSQAAPGKMGALQLALRYIKEEHPAPTVLFTDADAIVGSSWSTSMVAAAQAINNEKGGVIAGSVIFAQGGHMGLNAFSSVALYGALFAKRHLGLSNLPPLIRGANMAIRVGNSEIVDRLQALSPHVFPGEEALIRDTFLQNGGDYQINCRFDAIVFARRDRIQSIREYYLAKAGRLSSDQLYTPEYGEDLTAYVSTPQLREPLLAAAE